MIKINLISKKEREQLEKIREAYLWTIGRIMYNGCCGVITADEVEKAIRVLGKAVKHHLD